MIFIQLTQEEKSGLETRHKNVVISVSAIALEQFCSVMKAASLPQ
jgi:hypothetical protein